MSYKKKTDNNQKEIVNALRECGASVHPTHMVGDDFPDIVVGFRGKNYLLEIKTEKGSLTEGQKIFHDTWRGQVTEITTIDEALKTIGAI